MKRLEKTDLSKCEELIRVLEEAKSQAETPVDAAAYDLWAQYYRRLIRAKSQGRLIVGHNWFTPIDICRAMEMEPLCINGYAQIMAVTLGLEGGVSGASKAAGLAPELCGSHISSPGVALKGWMVEPDVAVWNHGPCDNTAKHGELFTELFGIPGFFLDPPYRGEDEAEIAYYTEQLRGLVRFLEDLTGRPMDWDRLREVMRLSAEIVNLRKEINELRKAVPCPSSIRWTGNYLTIFSFIWSGTPEGVAFHRLMRDEMKKRVAQGQGFIPQENYRVMFVGLPAAYDADFINWMQVEKGISVVSEPGISHYLGWEPDYSKPLESLARCRTYTTCWAMQGPLKEMWIPDAVAAAREYHVDGVMCWPARGCRQYPAALRAVADAIKREVGIPVVMMVDSDFNDPFFVSAEELMDNVEKALEIIDKK
ncbi:MAG: 2-hydroxyacyl-CoA dehydratase [Nitrospinae bacterium]|nr:2-hydroxyacyl-CoA dehydratase [Nitrospinota bacterium]